MLCFCVGLGKIKCLGKQHIGNLIPVHCFVQKALIFRRDCLNILAQPRQDYFNGRYKTEYYVIICFVQSAHFFFVCKHDLPSYFLRLPLTTACMARISFK